MEEEEGAKPKEACSGLKEQLLNCLKQSECMRKVEYFYYFFISIVYIYIILS